MTGEANKARLGAQNMSATIVLMGVRCRTERHNFLRGSKIKELDKEGQTTEIRFTKRPVFGQNVIPGIWVFDKAPESEAAGAARGKDIHL